MERNFLQKGSYIKDLEFIFYFVGFRSQGESCVFLIKLKDEILFSGVVDCYELRNCEKVEEILIQEGISELNMISLTHPHNDHSRGLLKIIEKYSNAETKLVIPSLMLDKDKSKFKLTNAERKIFDELKRIILTDSKRVKLGSISDAYPNSLIKKEYTEVETGASLPLDISAFAPHNTAITKMHIRNPAVMNVNLFSLAIFINIGNLNIFLGGDIEEDTIEEMDSDIINSSHIIKIPHHGSNTSENLIDKVVSGSDIIACSSVSRRHKLPRIHVLDKYKKKIKEVYLTSKLNKKDNKDAFGIVKFKCKNLTGDSVEVIVTKDGNATLY